MQSSQPKVSIIIPVYNGANYLRQAIDSALAQTYTNTEVLVINDGSTDLNATEDIILSYGDKIRYFKKENGGVATALNLGINKMSGDYFSWLSHDDMYHPQKIEKQISELRTIDNPNTISVCNVTVINSEGQKIQSNHVSTRAQRSIRVFLAIDTETGLNGCALLIPRHLFDTCGT
ncbi:MAG: glycosyltransferase family 2 protein, partial [Anaerolineae bacterium]|nr:glycosyltransferase family 2 protein [Anaerolineae bacterium]